MFNDNLRALKSRCINMSSTDFKRLRKRLGQNFLTDGKVLTWMVNNMKLAGTEHLLEIGAGNGRLTRRLAPKVSKLICIELDDRFIEDLELIREEHPHIEIVHADILKLDIGNTIEKPAGERLIAVGNLPYYITQPIIMRLLTEPPAWDAIYVTVQKEVAERMEAEPKSKDYGIFTIACQYFAGIRRCFNIRPSAFTPPPKVESSFVELIPRTYPGSEDVDNDLFFKVVRAGFGQRRKTVLNSLSAGLKDSHDKGTIEKALLESEIDPKVRAEYIDIGTWIELASNFQKIA